MDSYIVEKGDIIESIGRKFSIPVVEIIRANNLKVPYLLTEGQSLSIPTNLYNIFDYYTIKRGDNLYDIAKLKDTEVDVLTAINGLNKNEYIYEGQVILVPKKDTVLYITKTGDTIDKVADFFKTVSTDVLYSNNDVYLLPGQLIVYKKAWHFNDFLL